MKILSTTTYNAHSARDGYTIEKDYRNVIFATIEKTVN